MGSEEIGSLLLRVTVASLFLMRAAWACLIGPTLYLVLAGARDPMLIDFGGDWKLHGLLC